MTLYLSVMLALMSINLAMTLVKVKVLLTEKPTVSFIVAYVIDISVSIGLIVWTGYLLGNQP